MVIPARAARARYRRLLTKHIPVWLVAGQEDFNGKLIVRRFYNREEAAKARREMKKNEFYRVGKVWRTRVPIE